MKKKNKIFILLNNLFNNLNKMIRIKPQTKALVARIAPIVLFVLFALIPIFELISLFTGLDFRINGEMAFGIIFALISLAGALFFLIFKARIQNAAKILTIFTLPLALITAISFACGENKWTILPMLIWLASVLALYIKLVPDSNLKAFSAVISVLLVITLGVVWCVGVVGDIFVSELSVESEYISIDERYKAEVCIDDSLFGAKTVVRISRTDAEFGVLIGRFWRESAIVYEGEDYEYRTVQINWLDETTVVINGREYVIA